MRVVVKTLVGILMYSIFGPEASMTCHEFSTFPYQAFYAGCESALLPLFISSSIADRSASLFRLDISLHWRLGAQQSTGNLGPKT